MTATYLGESGDFPLNPLPLYLDRVSAGFPSPAQDYVEQALDLNQLLVKRTAVQKSLFIMINNGRLGSSQFSPSLVRPSLKIHVFKSCKFAKLHKKLFWGIGGKLTARLEKMGIKTALDLADADPQMIRKRFSILVEKTVRELNGVSCLNLEEAAPTKQEIVCSRSFGERIQDFQAMREAITEYTSRGAEKLRDEKRLAKRLTVFIRTSPFNQQEPQYSNAATLEMVNPTDDTLSLVKAAHRGLESIWKDGFRFAS